MKKIILFVLLLVCLFAKTQNAYTLLHAQLTALSESTEVRDTIGPEKALNYPFAVLLSHVQDSASSHFVMQTHALAGLLTPWSAASIKLPFDSTWNISTLFAVRSGNDTFLSGTAHVINTDSNHMEFSYCTALVSNASDCALYKPKYALPKKMRVPACSNGISAASVPVIMQGILVDVQNARVCASTVTGTMVLLDKKIEETLRQTVPSLASKDALAQSCYILRLPKSLETTSVTTLLGASIVQTNDTSTVIGMFRDFIIDTDLDGIVTGSYALIQPITCDMIAKMK